MRYRPVLVLSALFGLALLIVQLLLLDWLHPLPYQVPIGAWPDQLFVERFYDREGKPLAYRWSGEGSRLRLGRVGSSAGTQLLLHLGEMPREVLSPRLALSSGEHEFAAFAIDHNPRRYRVLIPRSGLRDGTLDLGLHSPLFSTLTDPRRLGVRVSAVGLDFAAGLPVFPAPRQVLEQFVLLALCGLTLRRLGWSTWLCGAALALLAPGMLLIYSQYLLLLDHYMGRLLGSGALLAALAWWLPQRLARLRSVGSVAFGARLVTLLVLACGLRLAGALFPTFAAHDLPRNIGRFLLVQGGDLVIVARSAEFGGGFTIYPPAPYVVLLPLGLLAPNVGLIVQGGLALIDGTSALLIALLALGLGLSRRVALLAGLFYGALPIAVTGLWWGFTAQTFGQWLMAPLALLLLLGFERGGWPWVGAGVLLTMALLSHIGVTILALAWLGLALVALFVSRWPTWRVRGAFLAVLALSGLLGFWLIYEYVAGLKIAQALKIGGEVASDPFQATYSLIWKGLLISYSPLGLALIPIGLLLLRRRLHGPAALLIWSWVATTVLFFGVELLSGLQVRYIYFFMPPGCIAIALLLERLAARGAWGRNTIAVLLAVLLLQGALYWYSGTFEDVKLSITPLSH